MSRGRPKKNTAVEVLPPEDNQSQQSNQRVVEVKHKTEWSELRPVDEASEGADIELEDAEIEDRQPRRKTPKNERDELRRKLAQNNVTPASNLKLTIEKYSHSEIMDGAGGMSGDTGHCTKYPCVESHITNEDYLDVARNKWGAGMYRFTLRMQNKIVTAWDKRINGGVSGPVVQHINPADPTSPHVIVNMPEGQQTVTPIDPFKEAERALSLVKKYNEAFGAFQPQGAANPARSEEEILAGAILKQPEVIENVVGSVIKRFGGKSDNDEPWYADVVRDAVKSGQAAQIVQVAIDRIFNGFSGMFPGRQNNGQAPMGAQTVSPVADTQNANPQESRTALSTLPEGQRASAIQETVGDVQGSEAQGATGHQQQITPAEQALMTVVADCQKNVPPQVTFTNLMTFADAVNDQAPAYSIDGWIEYFAAMPVEAALEFVKSQPNGEAIASLPHAQAWTTDLQRLIKEAGQEGDE